MCEIFFLYSRNGTVNEESLEGLLKAALPAAKRNNDGFGIFNDKKKVFKTKKKLKNGHIPNMVDKFSDSKFVVVHLRLKTRGKVCKANSHPFQHDNHLLVHNGSVSPETRYGKERADSYHMLRDILDRKEGDDTVEAIKESMDNTSGRVSVFLHDDQHNLYYFRESSKFTFAINPITQEYVGATRSKRLHNIWDNSHGQVQFFDNLQTRDAEENIIYKIDEENIHEVGEFEMDGYRTTGKKGKNWRSKNKNYKGHPKRAKNKYKTGKEKEEDQTTSGEEEIEACCVLREDDIGDDLPTPEQVAENMGGEDEEVFWSEERYQKEKAGMTEEEWDERVAEKIAENVVENPAKGMTDIYDLQESITGLPSEERIPGNVAEEVYQQEEIPDQQDELEKLEQMEIDMYEKQEGDLEGEPFNVKQKKAFLEGMEERYEQMLEESEDTEGSEEPEFPEVENNHEDRDMLDLYQPEDDEPEEPEQPKVRDLVDIDDEGMEKLFQGEAS